MCRSSLLSPNATTEHTLQAGAKEIDQEKEELSLNPRLKSRALRVGKEIIARDRTLMLDKTYVRHFIR